MIRATFAVAAALGLVPIGAWGQSTASAPVPLAATAKADVPVAFVAQAVELPASVVALPLLDPREIDAVRAANTLAAVKRLQVGVGRSAQDYAEASSDALSWRRVEGGYAGRWEVLSPGAQAMRIELQAREQAPGVELRFAGSRDPASVYGPFTAMDAAFWSPVLEGDVATVEVFVPRGAARPALAITRVSHLFVSPTEGRIESLAKTGESGSCNVDLVCESAGNAALANIGKSVARMVFNDGASSFLCTGTLVGSTDATSTPYFYSAAHCIDTQAVASTLTTHWFFDRTGCNSGSTSPGYKQVAGGATLLYSSAGSDVLLLRLNNPPPAGAWFAGWDATAVAVSTGLTGVHHPSGDWKKVSRATMDRFDEPSSSYLSNGYIVTVWSSGVTEGGSSGSGIFSAVGSPATDYRLRGGLWGGASGCGQPPSLMYDFYSRLDLAYNSIRQWIDPPPPSGTTLAVTKLGTGTGTITSSPTGINCGTTCLAPVDGGLVVALYPAASSGSMFAGWAGDCSGVAPCTVTMDRARSVTATFSTGGMSHMIGVSAGAIAFGGQSMGTTSPPSPIVIMNVGPNTVTFGGIAIGAQFGQAGTCNSVSIDPGRSCELNATFAPAVTAIALGQSAPVNGQLTISSIAAGSPHVVALAGTAEKSLVTHYYRSILRRAPDAGGKAFWEAQAQRLAGLGVSVSEAWYAMAMSFYGSAEYAAFNRGSAAFVTDLYNTFFNRTPDGGGLSYWNAEIVGGLPRGVALAAFMFSPEFRNFSQGIFGSAAVRPEVDAVVDFYRGLLGRLPDSGGFGFWLQRFRAAQCSGQAAVVSEVESISSAFANSTEYLGRARNHPDYIGDLYNAFLRRGGDRVGVQFWVDQVATGAQTREQVRAQFKNSAEFQARVNAILAAPCIP